MFVSRPIAAVLLAGTLALTACGGGSGSDGAGSEPGSSTSASSSSDGGGGGGAAKVDIVDFAFDPAETEAKVGDTVTFTNSDDAKHTATSTEGDPSSFDTGDIDGGKTAEITLDKVGDYKYQCSIHEYMKGTIRVME
jgi:plastocyanin